MDEEWINQRWDEIKAEEKALSPQVSKTTLLSDVPVTLPAITRAVKLQKKASSVGFDWPEKDPGVVDKIREELDEVIVELEAGNTELLEKEIGDLLFAVVNLARHHKINPEVAPSQVQTEADLIGQEVGQLQNCQNTIFWHVARNHSKCHTPHTDETLFQSHYDNKSMQLSYLQSDWHT